MADRVKKVSYVKVMVPNRAGQGARLLEALRDGGVNLTAFHAFPAGGGKTQVDLVAEDGTALRRAAKTNAWKLSSPKRAFIIEGEDRAGAVQRQFKKLADAGVNAIASSAIAAGRGRFGMILWVRPQDFTRASRALSAR
ncbi:MAG: hypothetical protein ACREL7_09555 [Longimicrobiales bacterium]